MSSKPPPKKDREAQSNPPWKRKRSQNPNSSSSETRTPKKSKHSHHTPLAADTSATRTHPPSAAADPHPTAANTTTTTTTSWASTHPPASSLPPALPLTHTPLQISVISSTSINKKVASVLAHLVHPPPLPSTPPVAVLTAKAAVASKMITVVEIAKRQIASEGGRWWAYCAVGEVREERGREGEGGKGKGKGKADKASGKGDGDGEEAEEEEMDGVFETMKTPFERSIEGKPKIRAVPVMTIYLARVKIEELGRVYGEQTNVQEGRK